MNGAVTGIAVIVALAAVVVAIYALARRNRPAGEPGQPDANTEKVVAGLMTETVFVFWSAV